MVFFLCFVLCCQFKFAKMYVWIAESFTESNVPLIQASVKDRGILSVKPEAWAHTLPSHFQFA